MLSPTSVLISIISCSLLSLLEPFGGTCLGHALSKICQYTTTYDKVSIDLLFALIKVAQTFIQKCITQTKKSNKGKQAWDKVCIEYGLWPRKINMPMKTRQVFYLCSFFKTNLIPSFLISFLLIYKFV
jgi:hypothetical protein